MAKAQNSGVALAKLEREREALRAAAVALDVREKQLRKALAREGAERLAAAFSGLDLGDVSKAQAYQFAKAVSSLGLSQALAPGGDLVLSGLTLDQMRWIEAGAKVARSPNWAASPAQPFDSGNIREM